MRFTEEEMDKCRAAMAKPAPLDALRLIASGRVLIELTKDNRHQLRILLQQRLTAR
ncbi:MULTISPECIES: hypothetical protein [Hyphomicrobiales]|uniref:hypothetical protein n=1 Tax=Hyphomicrobiales TaxID=356 RepID=UPI00211A1392|nr:MULTISPECIES: hypothetical protein [Hyphomicrobiales]MCQ9147335.1 hypothetical protein [Ochrobactrum sp. BTU2]MDH1271535.1 hypothetical protein [Agrobacterium pusense]MDX4076599.1 hypothetical protein [Brucella sp. NBRC 113783]